MRRGCDLNGDGVHDWHDLEPVKERIRRLKDTRNIGHADRSQIFTEGFNEEISGVVAGVLPGTTPCGSRAIPS